VSRCVLALAFAALLLAGCGSSRAHGGAGIVTAGASIGTLAIDRSTASDIVAFAGTPDMKISGKLSWPGVPRYRAFGYGCSQPRPKHAWFPPLSKTAVFCHTVYYVSEETRRLAGFWTDSASFQTAAGTTPGMAQAEANRREGKTPGGPWFAIYQGKLLILSVCKRESPGHCAGQTVGGFALESSKHPIGLTFT
jgi:hypothetical protein